MIISRIKGGIGNQLFQYAMGRRLAHKLNTEFKLDISYYNTDNFRPYSLNLFNITATLATAEEISSIKTSGEGIKNEVTGHQFDPQVLDYPDNIYLNGYWEIENYFSDIRDIICKEFTLRQPLGTVAQEWKEKILAAECSVSLHVRHGDFAYNPNIAGASIYKILPLNYYQECINYFKREFKNPTLFVFSDNLEWCKENLQAGIPTNFVEGEDLTDENELYLMSICKHNIIANSTFSWWGAWLNQNPDKKVFAPIPSSIVGTKNTYRGFSAETNENSPLESERWIKVPFDLDNQPDITQRPIFSLLLVVNNDAATIAETLDSLLGQDYKYYEVIIIDNASTDGSETICRQAAKSKANVIYKRLRKKVSNSVAWNRAFKATQGQYVSFLKNGDCFLSNSLSTLYLINERRQGDIIHMFAWLAKNENGTVTFGDKKYAEQRDARLKGLNKTIMSTNGIDAARILLNQQFNSFLGTKFYNCDFLKQKKIKFDERLSDNEAELFFKTESFFKSKCLIYAVNAFYIAP